jgi:hypothetical protein
MDEAPLAFADFRLDTLVLDIQYEDARGVYEMTEEEIALSWAKRIPNLKYVGVLLLGDGGRGGSNLSPLWLKVLREDSETKESNSVSVRRLSKEDGRRLDWDIIDLMPAAFIGRHMS